MDNEGFASPGPISLNTFVPATSRRDIIASRIAAALVTVERMESVPREQQVMARAVRMADQLIAALDGTKVE